MKLPFSKDMIRRTALMSFIFFFAAHGFCVFNLSYSGSSVMLDVSRMRTALIGSGQFLAPYYFALRGTLSAPLWVGMLGAAYLALTCAATAWLLRLERPLHLFVLCGAMTANAAITSLFAADLNTADAALLAMLLAALSAAFCLRLRFGFIPGAALLGAAMALDPGVLAFFAALALLACLADLLSGIACRPLALSALQALLAAAAAIAFWALGCMLVARRSGIDLNLSLHMPGLLGAYLAPFRALAAPLTAYAFLSNLLRMLLLAACIALLALNARKLGAKRMAAVMLCVLLLPSLCALPLFYLPEAQQITSAYCLLDVLLLVLLVSLMPQSRRIERLVPAAFGALFLGSIVFSNQIYLKKNLEFESTLSLTSRIIDRMEETEGYRPGFTPVAIIGSPDESVFSVQRTGFEHLSALNAASANYAVTNEDELLWYCWEILGYPSNFVSGFELSQLRENDVVKAMPLFPADGCCAFVDGVLVIRLN